MKKRDMITIGLQRYAEAMENLLKTIIDDDECEHEWEEWRYLYECKKCGATKNREQGCEHSHIKSMCPKCCDKDQPEWEKEWDRNYGCVIHNGCDKRHKDFIRAEVITKLCEEIKKDMDIYRCADGVSARWAISLAGVEAIMKRWLA